MRHLKGTGRVEQVAELMADGDGPDGTPITAAAIGERLGLNASYVRQLQTRIRQQIDDEQRRAGFGRWAV